MKLTMAKITTPLIAWQKIRFDCKYYVNNVCVCVCVCVLKKILINPHQITEFRISSGTLSRDIGDVMFRIR